MPEHNGSPTSAQTESDSWFPRLKTTRPTRLRLFGFPYAGVGITAFRGWADALPPGVEFRPALFPGRESRWREKALAHMAALADHLFTAIQPWLDLPFAFYGHSLGGLIAFELTRQLRREHTALPVHLFISSRRPPHLPDRYQPIHALPDPAFIQAVQERYNGIPSLIQQDPELMALFLPTLRADFSVFETYPYIDEPPLEIPLSIFGGEQDPGVSRAELAEWRRHTTAAFSQRMFPGDHFFLQSQRAAVLAEIAHELALHLPAL